uniref:Uncharacterized protein n=1 Tax=Globodera rostochiensis TaxID=31243 RepID=A0A914HAD2_GLORO
MTASAAETSTHEKILEAIQKGELQTEGEDAIADGEDVGEAEDDESHSEAGSDDFIDSVFSQQHIVKADDELEPAIPEQPTADDTSMETDEAQRINSPQHRTTAAGLTRQNAAQLRGMVIAELAAQGEKFERTLQVERNTRDRERRDQQAENARLQAQFLRCLLAHFCFIVHVSVARKCVLQPFMELARALRIVL